MLKNSPYKDQLATPELFVQALQSREKDIPNLISPHLGDRVQTNWSLPAATPGAQPANGPADASNKPATAVIAALPLGGRIKVDPWNNTLEMLKSKPICAVAEREKMPFEVTPFILYLSREAPGASSMLGPGSLASPSQSAQSASRDAAADSNEKPRQ